MAHLFRVIVPVADIEKAARFYAQVLGSAGQRVSPGRHYFRCEGTILACYDPKADGDEADARPLREPLYLAVDDLEETYANASAAGASFSADVVQDVGPLGAIAQRPWGERSFYAGDPFGNPLCFVARDSVFTG
jgi:catechol 2,3-dioxygenase-like lactoylglutathione lyase family enzyme